MRIGIDARPLRDLQTTGISRYVRSVLMSLAKVDPVNDYILYADRDFSFSLPSPRWSKRTRGHFPTSNLWMQCELPFWLKGDRVDIFWGTQHALPLLKLAPYKNVLTMLDLVCYLYPQTMRTMNRVFTQRMMPLSIRRADVLVGISQNTLDDVVKIIHPIGKEMVVTHLGCDEKFKPREGAASAVKTRFGLENPFILSVGTFEPRKNIQRVIETFASIADRVAHDLVIVGASGWKNEDTRTELRRSAHRERIRWLGYVDDEWLPDLYSAADVFVYPSLYEGFGIPPLEAMACGCAVVSSKTSSLPEVVGDAALLVDPFSVDDIQSALLKILHSPTLRQDLRARSLEQAKKFSWGLTAQKMLEVFERWGPAT